MGNKISVIAYGMHEHELRAAENLLENPKPTDAFVVGEIDEARVGELERAGLIVERVPSESMRNRQLETPGLGASPLANAGRRSTAFSTRRIRINDQIDLARPNVYLVQIMGPLLEDRRRRLAQIGVELMESYGGDSYSSYLRAEQVAQVRALDFVSNVQLFGGEMTAPASRAGVAPNAEAPATADGAAMVTYDVRVHREQDVAPVSAWLQQHNVAIAGTSRRKLRIYLLENSSLLGPLANLPEVEHFEEYVPPKLSNDRARLLLNVPPPPPPGAVGLDGTNQIIGIADTGIDDAHPDFAGRLLQVFARGRPGVPGNHDDPHGHGTHVTGSAAGDGVASNGLFKGTAPGAKIVFQSLLDSAGGLGGLPLDLGDLFDEAYQSGARIHSNSWGSATNATYTMNSSEVDDYIWRKPDLLVVIAAGNEGQEVNRQNTQPGTVDWLSVGSPATSKNALTVGASRSDRASGGLSTITWGAAWPAHFTNPPIANETVSGNPQCLAGFSSRGPCDDRRIKPDVVAPGTDIVSARSAKAPARNYWGQHANPQYAYMGGTSMATPLVSGCAALVRQYYTDTLGYPNPSAALLRATLINGTRWLTGGDANSSNPPPANYDQGFGCVDMSTTIPSPANNFMFAYVDSWQTPGAGLIRTGDRRRWLIMTTAVATLRICLAYTDYPARALQNNLNLLVQLPDNSKLTGNRGLRQSITSVDADNNVEIVRIDNAAVGNYLIQITASNLLHAPQEFALVVTGQIQGQLTPI